MEKSNARSTNQGRLQVGGQQMKRQAVVIRTVILSALWWVLTEGEMIAGGVGVASVAGAVAVSLVLLPPRSRRVSLKQLPFFLAFFLMQSIKGGVQVAATAMRPRLNLQPAMLEIHLDLPDESARVVLASVLNLLPGTLSTGLSGNTLLLHVLDRRLPVERSVRKAEAHVARLLGAGPQ